MKVSTISEGTLLDGRGHPANKCESVSALFRLLDCRSRIRQASYTRVKDIPNSMLFHTLTPDIYEVFQV
jgi:hypothetical protein